MKSAGKQGRGWLAASAIVLAAAGWAMAAPAAAKDITVLRTNDADTYDPHRAVSAQAFEINYLLTDTLVSLDFDLKTIRPLLAKSWTVSDDALTYTFELRDDVTFCNGKKFTAADVVYSIKRVLDPKTTMPFRWRLGDVEDVTAEGDYRVVYKLKRPFSELLYQLTQNISAIVDEQNVAELGGDFGIKGLNGTGPFCWERWEPRNQFTVKRNPAYRWGPPIYGNTGPAKVDRIVWKVIPQENALFAAMASGQGDMSYTFPLSSVEMIRRIPTIRYEEPAFNLRNWYVGFKITRPNLQSIEVRRALIEAIDQGEIARNVFFGLADPQMGYIYPKALDYEGNIDFLKYDPEAAKARLDREGWKPGPDGIRVKDGARLELLAYTRPDIALRMFEAVQAYWRRIGVDLKLEVMDSTVFFAKGRGQDFDSWAIATNYVSSGDILGLLFDSKNVPTPNRMNWKDETTDRLLAEGKFAKSDQERQAAYSALQKRLYEAALWAPLVNEKEFLISNTRVTGTKPHGIYGRMIYKGLDLDLKK